MKKAFIAIILIASFSLSLYAGDMKKVSLNVDIPEDYNVVVPDGISRLDKLVLELQLEPSSNMQPGRRAYSSVISSESGLDITDALFDAGSLRMTLLYYGNLSYDYRVRVSVDTRNGWLLSRNSSIPIEAELRRSAECDEDIAVTENIDGSADIIVPSNGLRQGVPAADILLSWDRLMNIMPGRYSAEIVLSLEAL